MSEAKRQKIEKEELNECRQHDECLPIKCLEELKNWNPLPLTHVTAPLLERVPVKNQPKTLLCHDMKGGYLDDRFIDGTDGEDNFYFLHWASIDIFVYFSHHFVTIPPCSWISASHRNGVKILGTFITEWDDGVKICEDIFKDENAVQHLCSQLVKVADHYNFDGWLINIENKLTACQIPFLKEFLKILTMMMHSKKPGSLIVWYDSVCEDGRLKWQNALNSDNKVFFSYCDGIFLNYNWTDEKLQQSVDIAGTRKTDIFVGVDVFGRGCPGGGGFDTNFAVSAARKFDLSVAIFAPGWLHECLDTKNFKENQFKFWNHLQEFCPPRAIKSLPFFSSFCPGFGRKVFQNGKVLSEKPWFNVSLQQPQPIYYSTCFSGTPNYMDKPSENGVSIYDEDAFNGGGCLHLSGIIDSNESLIHVFQQRSGVLNFKLLETSFKFEEISSISYVYKRLSPTFDVILVLHLISDSNSNYDLLLASKTWSETYSSDLYTLPASQEEKINTPEEVVKKNLSNFWEKRMYVLNCPKFKNYIVENITCKITSKVTGIVQALLGEIKILPIEPRIHFIYTDLLSYSNSEERLIVQCVLKWSYHPSIYCSDLFRLVGDEKIHLTRTSQFYYNLELQIEKTTTEVEILLSPQSSENDCFPMTSLKIPVTFS